MTAQQADRTTLTSSASDMLTSPYPAYHALLYSEIEINCSVGVNGLDGENTSYKMHHPGQGDLVLSVGTEGITPAFTDVYVKRVGAVDGLVELKPVGSIGNLVPGQFIPAGRTSVEVNTTKSFVRLAGGVPGKGSSNTNIVLFEAPADEIDGGAFTVTTSATAGSKIAINEGFDGLYIANASLCSGATVAQNSYLLVGTVNNTLQAAEIRASDSAAINKTMSLGAVLNLVADDEVYLYAPSPLASPNTDDNDNQLTLCGPL